MTRAAFIVRLIGILGDVRLLWLPKAADTTTSITDDPSFRTVTWDATVASRLSSLGRGTSQSFVAASSQYGTTPDTADLSFGDGAADSAFSIIAFANVTDTATP